VIVYSSCGYILSYSAGKSAGEVGMIGQDADDWPTKTGDDGGQSPATADAARVGLNNFTFIKVLGKGSFGKVYFKSCSA